MRDVLLAHRGVAQHVRIVVGILLLTRRYRTRAWLVMIVRETSRPYGIELGHALDDRQQADVVASHVGHRRGDDLDFADRG